MSRPAAAAGTAAAPSTAATTVPASSADASSGPALYKHALESVFSFLDLAGLHKVCSVSKLWLSAVLSMKSYDAGSTYEKISAKKLRNICDSRLRRHVGALGDVERGVELPVALTHTLADQMAHLVELACVMNDVGADAFSFPRNLKNLNVTLGKRSNVAASNTLLRSIAASLPALEELFVRFAKFDDSVSLEPLCQLKSLKSLELRAGYHDLDVFEHMSDAQLESLRALSSLKLLEIQNMSAPLLARLLRAPHNLQIEELNSSAMMSRAWCELLPSLPSLTSVHLVCDIDDPAGVYADFSCLLRLPRLRSIDIGFMDGPRVLEEGALKVLPQLCKLTKLELSSARRLTSADVRSILAPMSLLEQLSITGCSRIADVSFLEQAPFARTLRTLELGNCGGVVDDIVRVLHPLQALTDLTIQAPKSSVRALKKLFTPPCALLPALRSFYCDKADTPLASDDEEDGEDGEDFDPEDMEEDGDVDEALALAGEDDDEDDEEDVDEEAD